MLTDLSPIWDHELTHDEWAHIAKKEHPGFYAPPGPRCRLGNPCSRYPGHKGPCIKLIWTLKQEHKFEELTTAYTIHTRFELVEETPDSISQIVKFGDYIPLPDPSVPDNRIYQITLGNHVIV